MNKLTEHLKSCLQLPLWKALVLPKKETHGLFYYLCCHRLPTPAINIHQNMLTVKVLQVRGTATQTEQSPVTDAPAPDSSCPSQGRPTHATLTHTLYFFFYTTMDLNTFDPNREHLVAKAFIKRWNKGLDEKYATKGETPFSPNHSDPTMMLTKQEGH